MTSSVWDFGWTQVFTSLGFLITIGIAFFGFQNFDRWRREKIEERKLDIAIEALALAYEAKYVFQSIRSPMSFAYESKDMPRSENESNDEYRARAPYYAILTRMERNKDFFERLFKLQPRFMALFGVDKEQIFMKCHEARRYIEVSAGMLMKTINQRGEWNENRRRQHDQWEADIWEGMDAVVEDLPNARRVSNGLKEFQQGIISVCQPVAERK